MLKKVLRSLNPQFRQTARIFLSLIVGFVCAILIANNLTPIVTPAVTPYKISWIGNTYGGGEKWVQNYIEGMYVSPDGTVYTNSYWDEGGREAGIYKDGNAIAQAVDTHGWGRVGGKAVTANNKYLFLGMAQQPGGKANEDNPPEGTIWHCVRRYDLSGRPATFFGGRGWDKSMLIVSTKTPVTGLATVGDELFVSDPGENLVRVYNIETMEEVRSFSIERPGQLTADRQGNLWVIQSPKVLRYSPDGKKLPEEINVAFPTAIAIDNQGRLLVADNGPRQQVNIYNITGEPALEGTLGSEGGIYAGVPGEIGDLRFYGISGVGADALGNIYVNNNGWNNSGTDLRKFSPDGKLEWRLLGLIFVDNADTDPTSDGVDVFTKHERFEMDFSKEAGKQWNYKAYTVNPFKYPQDPRLHSSPDATFIRRIQGKPFMFLADMYNSFLQIYRFAPDTDGYIAIPAGMLVNTSEKGQQSLPGNWPPNQPQSGEWIWSDRNGNGSFESEEFSTSQDYPYTGGWWVDSKGDIWKAVRTQDGVGIRHFPLQGLDNNGNPIYSYDKMQKIKHPEIFTDLRRIEYFPETDTMYLSGYTKEHPAKHGDQAKSIGSEIARYDNWSQGNYKEKWRIVPPKDISGHPEILEPAAISVAGDRIFVVSVKTAEVHVYNATTSDFIQILRPGPVVAGESGWVDIPYGVRAFRRSNGEYLVFVEENTKGKVIIYTQPN